MNSNLIELTLRKDVDSLYTELVADISDNVRAPMLSPTEAIREGRKRFEEIRREIRGVVCSESVLGFINSQSDEKKAAIGLIDAINLHFSGIDFPVVTVACLIIKIGINRFCQTNE